MDEISEKSSVYAAFRLCLIITRESIRLTIPVAFISQISLVFKVSVWVVFEKCGELYTLQSFTEIHSDASGTCFDVKSGMV